MANVIFGRNSVMEALKSGHDIDKILVSGQEGSIKKIVGLARDKGIPVMNSESKRDIYLPEGEWIEFFTLS